MTEENTEQALRDEFKDKIKNTTLEELPAVISSLIDRQHDYGTICVAMGIAAATTAWAMNKHQNGGISGFQAGAVAWEMLRHWGALYPGECGGRMLDYNDLLFPQYADKFTAISASTWAEVQKQAAKKLDEADLHAAESVVAHWRSVAEGNVPFGLTIAA